MKNELFHIGSLTVHGYGFMIALGFALCMWMAVVRAKKYNLNPEAILDIGIYGLIFGFLGAKLLFILVEWENFLANPKSVIGTEGFVVYGGIIAGVLTAVVYCSYKKLNFLEYFDLAVPSVALAQGFGRIGCLLAGCCYGRVTDAWYGIVFPTGCMAPAGVKLLPTQIISSAGDFLLTIFLLLYYKHSKKSGDTALCYVLLYAVGRFFVEMLRSDDRGGVGIFSTSQVIALLMAVGAGAVMLFRKKKK